MRKNISESQYVEQIVEASEFFKKDYDIDSKGNSVKVFDKLVNLKPNNNLIKNLDKLGFGLIDIYFPVDKHRENWSGDESLLVAAVNPRDIEDSETFIAYDLNGEEVILSTTSAPEIPVLVVTYSEKKGNYKNETKKMNLGKTNSDMKAYLSRIFIKKDYDPWPLGDMEIYLKVNTRIGFDNWTGWQERTIGAVSANSVKDFVPGIEIASSPLSAVSLFILEIWEEDFSSGDDFVADAYYDQYRFGTGSSIYSVTWGSWQSNGYQFGFKTSNDHTSIVDGTLGIGEDYDTMHLTYSN